jgi:putative FmdB family regulatory protein
LAKSELDLAICERKEARAVVYYRWRRILITDRTLMPLYEYSCRKCGKKFSEVLTIKEHEKKKIQCPKCQSSEVQKIIEPFFAKTARKS